jgi:glycosyltransferase involved in cell wall biosynthesis
MAETGKKPTILFMGRIFQVPWGGVRVMAEELLRAAAPHCKREGRTIEVLVPEKGIMPPFNGPIVEVVLPKFAKSRILWDHWTVSNYANSKLNSVLYNIKLVLPERLRIPGFTTFHDLMYFPQPDKYDWQEYLWTDSLYMRMMVGRTVRKGTLIHTVSKYTAQDARELFPQASPDQFRPIHHGVNPEKWSLDEDATEDLTLWGSLKKRGVREPFVFYCGGLSRRKNVGVLLEAFERFKKRFPSHQLVLAGGDKPTNADSEVMDKLARGSKDILQLGVVSEQELARLYQHADFFVFPSLYEGFGLPLLEAQVAGCPVICADATSLPEVVGRSALLFDPKSVDQLLERMLEVQKLSVRKKLIHFGRENARRFPWDQSARGWLALADEVAGRG